jgi:hypothetical protein
MMALHPNFRGPLYEVLPLESRGTAFEKLLPPLVAQVREEVKASRYVGALAILRATSSTCCVWTPLALYRPTWSMSEEAWPLHLGVQGDRNLRQQREDTRASEWCLMQPGVEVYE